MQQLMELPQPGDVIAGKYVVDRLLGRGGMGAVYVVSHRLTGKRLAVKCLLPEHMEHADIVERFMREAQAAGRIQHRYVVDVFDVGSDGAVLYIVMELLEGKPFSELLHDEALTLEETLAILLRAMEGVNAAHAHGIVHRDLKPDNIFVCVGNTGRLDDPRVLDFGISKLDDDAGRSLTRSGVAMGTPYYMSLEQMSGQRDLDARVDVYAMGVILYEAIAGYPPHVADSVSALAIRMLTTAPVALGHIRPDLPEGLADVIMKALARNREDRYASMQQLIEAVRPFVPQGANLLVPEGQGRPLRTPRGERASPVSVPVGVPGVVTTPSGASGPFARTSTPGRAVLAAESAATLAAPSTSYRAPAAGRPVGAASSAPVSEPAGRAVPATAAAKPAASSQKRAPSSLVWGALLALLLLGASAWWLSGRTRVVSAPPALPPAPSVQAVEVGAAQHPSPAGAAPTLPDAQPSAHSLQPSEPAREPTAGAQSAPPPERSRSARKKRVSATVTQPASEPAPEQPAAPKPSTVKARAGELGAEEF